MNKQLRLKGKPKRLAVLDYGLFEVHAGPRTIGICGFVIETDAGEVVLIDTGFPAKYAVDAEAATIADDLGSFGRVLSVTPQNMPAAQLGLLGLSKADVTLMIQSHTHIDHVGHMAGFAGGADFDRRRRAGVGAAPLLVGQASDGMAGSRLCFGGG